MPRLEPLDRAAIPDLVASLKPVEAILGFIPNSTLIMARHPALLAGFQQMATAALAPGKVAGDLKIMVGHIASRSAGCRYCIAHTGHIAERRGVPAAKLDALWGYETSALFTAAERAALHFAQAAAAVPNAVTDADFAALQAHFSDDQIVELLGVVALYGFLNRWNDSLATELESQPRGFAERHFAAKGWSAGKHAR